MRSVKLGLAILSLSVLANSALAATQGGYVGLGLGASRIQSEDQDLVPASGVRNSNTLGGLGGRVFVGYNFNRYVGLEAGIAHYAPSKYNASEINGPGSASLKYSMNAIDLVGKAYLPIAESGFNAYVLGGAARVNSKQQINISNGVDSFSDSQTTRQIRPIYGLGVSYDASNNVTTNLEFTQIKGKGSDSSIPNANMLSLNVAYNFGS